MSQIPKFHRAELIVPRSARGYGHNEFLYFEWTPELNASKFKVLLEDLAGRWVDLGKLSERVFIPNTYFPEHAKLVVVGLNEKGEQARFINELRHGHMYHIESDMAGDHYMGRSIPQARFNSL